jgi:Tfp pilus assembly protein PilX
MHREAGSAYITTLLALVVLTLLAMALVFVTGTEVQIATNERNSNRTFYSSDSGLGIAAGQALASGNYGPNILMLNQQTVGGSNVAERVEIAPMAPILVGRCDLCPANDDGVPEFWKVNHATTATAQRVAWNGTWNGEGALPPAAQLLGQKTLSVMFEFQPWPTPPVESIADATELQKIKF